MKLTQEQVARIIGIVLTTLIALLAVFGYDVSVVQPREAVRAPAQVEAAGGCHWVCEGEGQ